MKKSQTAVEKSRRELDLIDQAIEDCQYITAIAELLTYCKAASLRTETVASVGEILLIKIEQLHDKLIKL